MSRNKKFKNICNFIEEALFSILQFAHMNVKLRKSSTTYSLSKYLFYEENFIWNVTHKIDIFIYSAISYIWGGTTIQ